MRGEPFHRKTLMALAMVPLLRATTTGSKALKVCSADSFVCNDFIPPISCSRELVALLDISQRWKHDAESMGSGAAPYFPACYTLLQLYSESHGAPHSDAHKKERP